MAVTGTYVDDTLLDAVIKAGATASPGHLLFPVGYAEAYAEGYSAGYDAGYDVGFDDGTTAGYATGYAAGYAAGVVDGTATGYTAGYAAGLLAATPPTVVDPIPVEVPVVFGDPTYVDVVAEGLERLPQQFKDNT